MPYFIYVLKDPISLDIKYVGQTSRNPEVRLKGHLSHLRGDNEEKENWIVYLKNKGLSPILEIIEETTEDKACERERFWVSHYKSFNTPLLNGANHRPLKYGEQTTRINIRVPKSKKQEVLSLVRNYLKDLSA